MLTETSSPRLNVETIITLPTHTDAVSLAAACREEGLAFLRDSDRWGKAELAMWLIGPYTQLTQYHAAFRRRRSGEIARAVPGLQDVDARMIDRVLGVARAEVTTTLRSLGDPECGASFAFSMMSSGFVARCEDADGKSGWMPTNEPRRLTDRILSLFATDYLTRPADYDRALSIPPGGLGVASTAHRKQSTLPWGLRSA